MKSFRYIAIGVFIILSAFFAVTYTSCSKDACGTVVCQNKSTCNGGLCSCDTGTGGVYCETVYRELYNNTYKGNVIDTSGNADTGNVLIFNPGDTSTKYYIMHVEWRRRNTAMLSFDVKLVNNTSSGSSFIIARTASNSFIYTGSGTVTPYVASMNLTETDTVGIQKYYHFYSFAKQ